PRHGDRALDIESVEHVLEVARIIRPGGSKHEVVEYDPTCHVVLIGAGRHRMQSAEKLVVDAVSPRERNQHSLVAELPEEHSGGDHELGDAAREAANVRCGPAVWRVGVAAPTMASVWPAVGSAWALVYRIAGEDVSVTPDQVALAVGAATADAAAKILSISSSGKRCIGSLAIEK